MCKKLDQAVVASIMKMIPNGSRLELPSEQLTNYPQVKKALLNAGGKYKKCRLIQQAFAPVVLG